MLTQCQSIGVCRNRLGYLRMTDRYPLPSSCAPFVSLVMSTRNRARKLDACLGAIEKLTCRLAWEVIVVDNGSADETPRLLDEFSVCAKMSVTVAREAKPGLSRALNRALELARGKIIVFSDDDCYPSPDLLDRTLEAMEQRRLDYMGGRIELFDADDAPITIQTELQPLDIPPMTYIRPGLLQGCNMAVRRTVFDRIGLFDPLMGAGGLFRSSGDVDFLQRASLAGFVGGYAPSALTFHHHGRRGADVSQLRRRYAVGRGAFYAKILLLNPRFAFRLLCERRASAGTTIGLLKTVYWALRRDVMNAPWVAVGFIGCAIVFPSVKLVAGLRPLLLRRNAN